MAYTTPTTQTTGTLIDATTWNRDIVDNIIALKSPPSANYDVDEASNYTVSAGGAFVDVDGTNLSLTITTTGGDVMIHFHGTFRLNAAGSMMLNVTQDGSVIAADDGFIHFTTFASTDRMPISFTRLVTGVSAGSHTFNLRWKSVTATATLYAGAGTSNEDTHPQFWVREVS